MSLTMKQVHKIPYQKVFALEGDDLDECPFCHTTTSLSVNRLTLHGGWMSCYCAVACLHCRAVGPVSDDVYVAVAKWKKREKPTENDDDRQAKSTH